MSMLSRALDRLRIKSVPQHADMAVRVNSPTDVERVYGGTVSGSNAMALSAVWGCTRLISGTIASLPLITYRQTADERTPATNHPLYRLLHSSPNADQTAVDFFEAMSDSIELWGDAYAEKRVDENGRVLSLTPINPALVAKRRLNNGAIEYRWTEDGRENVRTDAGMLHIRGAGGNALGGMSTLHFASKTFGLAMEADRAARSLFDNGMRPQGQVVVPEWLSKEKYAELMPVIDRYIGSGNTGRPFIAAGGMKFEPLAINPEDAQMLETRRFSIEEICRFFGVPPHMVGHTETSTSWGTGLEQQTLGFVKFTLRRRLRRIEQALMKQLLTPAERARGLMIEFSLEGLLRGDSAGRAEFYRIMIEIGAMTINEVRRLENRPPVPGGDVPRIQMQNAPITEADTDDEADE